MELADIAPSLEAPAPAPRAAEAPAPTRTEGGDAACEAPAPTRDVEIATTEGEAVTPHPTWCGIWRPCFKREPELSKLCAAMFVLFLLGCIPGGIGGLISNIVLSLWLLVMTVRSLFFHAPHKEHAHLAETHAPAKERVGGTRTPCALGHSVAHLDVADQYHALPADSEAAADAEVADAEAAKVEAVAKPKKRLVYLDNLKILMAAFVVVHHSHPPNLGAKIVVRSYVTVYDQWLMFAGGTFAMPGFFAIAGYFECGAIEKHGREKFLASKFKHLGVVYLVMYFVWNPILQFVVNNLYLGNAPSYVPFAAHCWFILWLVLFSYVYSLVRAPPITNMPLPSLGWFTRMAVKLMGLDLVFTICMIVTGNLFFANMPAYIPTLSFYVAAFSAGIVAKRNRWLEQIHDLPRKDVARMRAVCVAGIVWLGLLAHAYFALSPPNPGDDDMAKNPRDSPDTGGGLHFAVLLLAAMSLGVLCPAICLTVIHFFQHHLAEQGPISAFCADATYAVYLLHITTNQCAMYAFVALFNGTHGKRDAIYFRDDDPAMNHGVSTTNIGEANLWALSLWMTVVGSVIWPLAHYLRAVPCLKGLL